jgi:hypothetical protein
MKRMYTFQYISLGRSFELKNMTPSLVACLGIVNFGWDLFKNNVSLKDHCPMLKEEWMEMSKIKFGINQKAH